MSYGAYDDPTTEGPIEVHPDQTAIPDADYKPGEIGICFWCSEPAVYDRIDIGLPKKPNQPKTLVKACQAHYRNTVLPALDRAKKEKEEKASARG